jgi:lipid A 4'-phosphatase
VTDPDVTWWRVLAGLLAAGFALQALFAAAPSIDLWAAGLFFDGQRFASSDAARVLRRAYHWVFVAVCVASAVGLVGSLARVGGLRVPRRAWGFAVTLLIVGPGLLANALLKENWGRARPDAVIQFGGDAAFTGPFVISDQCARNCSFVSGEGSSAAAVAAIAIALFWPARGGRRARAAAAGALALWLSGAAFIRMAPGKHFLSDTLFAFVLVGLAATVLYRMFGLRAARDGAGPRAAAADLGRIVSGALAAARERTARRG